MISRFFWNYIFGRARYPLVLGGLFISVFFANVWFFPTPYLQINGEDQIELSAKPGDEIPVLVAKFDSANGLWHTTGIRVAFPTESEAVIEVDVVPPTGSEWNWENFAEENKIKNVTVNGTLAIPRDLPGDGRTIRVDVIGAVSYSTVDSWPKDAEMANTLLVTLTTRQHPSQIFKIVEQKISVVSLYLGVAAGSLGILFLALGAVAVRSGRSTNRTLAYMRRTSKLLRDLHQLIDVKSQRLPEGYWKSDAVTFSLSEFDALSVRVTRQRTKLQAALDAAASQLGLKHIGNLESDRMDIDLVLLEENFISAYRKLTIALKEQRHWYQFWYWA